MGWLHLYHLVIQGIHFSSAQVFGLAKYLSTLTLSRDPYNSVQVFGLVEYPNIVVT